MYRLSFESVDFHRGVWHHPITALEAPAEFAMLAWEEGGPGDCVVVQLPEPLRVLVEG